jgi:phage head maturation protease
MKPDAARHAARRAVTVAHEPVGKPGGPGLWHDKHRQLPAYIQHIANDLISERGMSESVAIATAISMCKKWAAGGKNVHPDTRVKAAAAIAEWERLKASTHAKRSEPMTSGGYDGDGLDGSWDTDLGDLPDLTGLGVADFEAADGTPGDVSRAAPKLGTGARFAKLKKSLASKGASDPGALAAYIGRKKFGKAKFAGLAGKARKRKGGGMSRSELMRIYPLEDIKILTRAEGDGSGRVVEAYATVFDQPAEIRDHMGHYMEVIDRAAFDQVLGRIMRSPGGLPAQVKVLFNHGRTAGGAEAAEFQLPLGKPLDVRPEQRGLLTRTEYDASDPFTERVLGKIRAGTITAQSFVGGIIRSDPELRGPGDRHRARNGALTTVRRMVLGLREYGPVLYPAYSGAEILGVRMNLPGSLEDDPALDDEPVSTEAGEYVPGMDGDVTGGTPEEVHPTRDHAHRLLVTRMNEMCAAAGLVLPGRG